MDYNMSVPELIHKCEACGADATHCIIVRTQVYGYRVVGNYEIDIDSEEDIEEQAADGVYLCFQHYEAYETN